MCRLSRPILWRHLCRSLPRHWPIRELVMLAATQLPEKKNLSDLISSCYFRFEPGLPPGHRGSSHLTFGGSLALICTSKGGHLPLLRWTEAAENDSSETSEAQALPRPATVVVLPFTVWWRYLVSICSSLGVLWVVRERPEGCLWKIQHCCEHTYSIPKTASCWRENIYPLIRLTELCTQHTVSPFFRLEVSSGFHLKWFSYCLDTAIFGLLYILTNSVEVEVVNLKLTCHAILLLFEFMLLGCCHSFSLIRKNKYSRTINLQFHFSQSTLTSLREVRPLFPCVPEILLEILLKSMPWMPECTVTPCLHEYNNTLSALVPHGPSSYYASD